MVPIVEVVMMSGLVPFEVLSVVNKVVVLFVGGAIGLLDGSLKV